MHHHNECGIYFSDNITAIANSQAEYNKTNLITKMATMQLYKS